MHTALFIALLTVSLQNSAPVQSTKNANYVVGAQDVLNVTVFNEAPLSGRFRVENDGQFNYPFIGPLKAGGSTVSEIATLIRTKLADGYLRDPQVTVEVDQFRGQNVFVMGQVRSPGKYTLVGAVTLLEALAQAGSTTSDAGLEVLILHPKPAVAGPSISEDPTDTNVEHVSLRELQAGNLSANVTVGDGDTIFVPKAQRFYVTGYVHNPGPYSFEPNLTVLQAISMAGGLTELGSSSRVRIVRNKKEFDVKPTDVVHPEDTIIVRRRIL
jgi:polysaccharide export outer membrane protein